MKPLVISALALVSLSAYAQEDTSEEKKEEQPKNLISITTDGFGWAGSGTSYKFDKDKSTRDEQTTSEGKLALNYAYIFQSRFMLGGEIFYEGSRTKVDFQNGDDLETNSTTSSLAVILGYNFNENIYNSWWIMGKLGGAVAKTEVKDSTATPRNTDTEVTSGFAALEFGKRFQFSSEKMKAFTFSPSIELRSDQFGKDADDAGVESALTATINILKFDLLF